LGQNSDFGRYPYLRLQGAAVALGETVSRDQIKRPFPSALIFLARVAHEGYRIVATANAINLAFTSNFGLAFLNPDERALGGSLDSALTVGDSAGIGRLLALLGNLGTGQEATYKAIFAELDPGMFVAPQLLQFDSARRFGGGVLGCREQAIDDKSCLWGHVAGSRYKRGTERGEYRFEQGDSARVRIGLQRGIGSGWTAGVSLGYDDLGGLRYDGDRAIGDGEAVHGGIAVAKKFGAADAGIASLSLSGGIQTIDMTRRQSIFVSATGTSHFKTDYLGAPHGSPTASARERCLFGPSCRRRCSGSASASSSRRVSPGLGSPASTITNGWAPFRRW